MLNIETTRVELVNTWWKSRPEKTPAVFSTIDGKTIAIKDEFPNPTHTYKAKHGWMMGYHYLHNIFPQPFTYFLVSTGNAAIADFAYAHRLNEYITRAIGQAPVHVVNFWPNHYAKKRLGPDSAGYFTDGQRFRKTMESWCSGSIVDVDFNEQFWNTDACRDHLNKNGFSLTPANSLDITEGFTPTYTQIPDEFTKQLFAHAIGGEHLPREELLRRYNAARDDFFPKTLLVVQYGAGMLCDDCQTFVRNEQLPIDILAVSTGTHDTIADKIHDSSGRWQESSTSLREQGWTTSKATGQKICHVTEQEILFALQRMKKLNIGAEPSGAAGLAIQPRLESILGKEQYQSYEILAFINTGNGIVASTYKDIMNTTT